MARPPAHRRKVNPYDRAALAPLRRPATPSPPVDLEPTPHRVYLLRRIHSDGARWYHTAGWKIDKVKANAHVRDFERAGWVTVTVHDTRHRSIALTTRGRAAAGITDEAAPS